jgi:F0F1-type ATP synthase assembly protein I
MARSGSNGPTLSTLQAVAIASQFGVTLAVSVGLGLFVGGWLDGVAHTSFVFTLVGVLLGLAAGAMSGMTIYRAAMRKGGFERQARTTTSKRDTANDGSTEPETEDTERF